MRLYSVGDSVLALLQASVEEIDSNVGSFSPLCEWRSKINDVERHGER
ncbi:hypothetical protein TIFTF001_039099 [Ficus carica]|uniref:Uncharacterized protein n=1 Tax=Ficus carica TaxID=3494 RepID=A0AA88JFJ4_FICCA|nr:hypothetical protein TIFTF001_039099 [Ficus carica]